MTSCPHPKNRGVKSTSLARASEVCRRSWPNYGLQETRSEMIYVFTIFVILIGVVCVEAAISIRDAQRRDEARIKELKDAKELKVRQEQEKEQSWW